MKNIRGVLTNFYTILKGCLLLIKRFFTLFKSEDFDLSDIDYESEGDLHCSTPSIYPTHIEVEGVVYKLKCIYIAEGKITFEVKGNLIEKDLSEVKLLGSN